MPDKEGLDTIREVRRDFPDMRIIAMSGGGVGSAKAYLRIARHLGAQRTIERPVTLSKLVAVVNDVLALPPEPPA